MSALTFFCLPALTVRADTTRGPGLKLLARGVTLLLGEPLPNTAPTILFLLPLLSPFLYLPICLPIFYLLSPPGPATGPGEDHTQQQTALQGAAVCLKELPVVQHDNHP